MAAGGNREHADQDERRRHAGESAGNRDGKQVRHDGLLVADAAIIRDCTVATLQPS